MPSLQKTLWVNAFAGTFLTAFLSGCFDSSNPGDYYPGISDNSVPPSVGTYAVGGDVSGTIGAVKIEQVGGVPASQIASSLNSVNNASDTNKPSALVLRDASGGFSAGTITATQLNGPLNGNATSASVSGYSTGQIGPTLNIVSQLTLLLGGDTYPVASVSGTLNGSLMPNAMAVGSRVTFLFSGSQITLGSDSKLKLKSSASYRTVANGTDSFTFVYTAGVPNNVWVEVNRSVAPSYVAVETDVAGPIATGSPGNVIFERIDRDLLGEYNSTNGNFVAHQGGFYQVKGEITTAPTDWTTGDYCRLDLMVNGVSQAADIHYPTAAGVGVAASPCHLVAPSVLQLNPNDVVNIQLSFNRQVNGLGVQIPANQGLINRFEIARIQ